MIGTNYGCNGKPRLIFKHLPVAIEFEMTEQNQQSLQSVLKNILFPK